MLLLISVDNELSRLPLFCILSEQAGCFLLGAEQHNKRRFLMHFTNDRVNAQVHPQKPHDIFVPDRQN